jgi:hypothetical protein
MLDLVSLHLAHHALSQRAAASPEQRVALQPAIDNLEDEIKAVNQATPNDRVDHGAVYAASHGLTRSPHWHHVEQAFLHAHPQCEAGGGTEKLQVHHIFDFHEAILIGRPDAELDPDNLITLSQAPAGEYHILLGHLDDFRSINSSVWDFVHKYHGWTAQAIRNDPDWQKAHQTRPEPWDKWTTSEKMLQAAHLWAVLPPKMSIVSQYGLEVLSPDKLQF